MLEHMGVKNKAKIVVIDDHELLRQALAQLINQTEDLIFSGEAKDTTEALECIENIHPDVAVIDITLKGESGIELTKSLTTKYPELGVLILSMHTEPVYIERALQAGAKGYLLKEEANTTTVLEAIRRVFAKGIYLSDQLKGEIDSESTALSVRELEVLQIIAQGRTTRQIAKELHVSVKTVESHYANIKNKLHLKNSHELICYAVQYSMK